MEARLTLAQHEAHVISRASSFRVTAFLGRGRYLIREAATLEDARMVGRAMLRQGHAPMIYALYGCHQVHVENVVA